MVSAQHTDLVVVGLGAMGAATAYQARRLGLAVIGIDRFGASAPSSENYERLGFTPADVVERARALVQSG